MKNRNVWFSVGVLFVMILVCGVITLSCVSTNWKPTPTAYSRVSTQEVQKLLEGKQQKVYADYYKATHKF